MATNYDKKQPLPGSIAMWDTVQTNQEPLSHAMPCQRCGHELHVFLSCGDGCTCQPASLPGELSPLLIAS